ncbi:MAG: serine/threonine protein kinase [Planctomycetes bacterium]|nr:serine/threonine protein kinase [Planctomycetota bacterium]
MSAPVEPSPGLPAVEGYEILARLGSGATGVVFKARKAGSDRLVALKVLHPELARDRRFVARLQREARVSFSLDHPNLARGIELGEVGGIPCLVLEFVEGKSLKTVLRERGALPEEEVLSIGQQIGHALSHAHGRGVVHRDVKPGNVILEPSGRARLTDFGLARAPLDDSITREGATLGTPQYLAPEQARDVAAADARSDLYGLGATLFHAATGAPPFEGERIADVLTKVLFQPAPDPAARNPGLTPGLALVLRKLLLKDPARRYPSAEALLADLEAVAERQSPSVEASSVIEAPPRRPSARGRVALAFAVLALAAFGILRLRGGTGTHSGAPTAPPSVESVGAEIAEALGNSRKILAVGRLQALLAREGLAPSERRRIESAIRPLEPLAEQEFRRGLVEAAARAAKARFADVSEVFEREIPQAAGEAIGVAVDALPAPYAEKWGSALAQERRRFEARAAAGAVSLQADLDRHLLDLEKEVLALLEGRRYRSALGRIEASLDSFRDGEGRGPEDLLPADAAETRRILGDRREALVAKVREQAGAAAGIAAGLVRERQERFEKEIAAGRAAGAAAAFGREARDALRSRGIDPAELPAGIVPDPGRLLESGASELALLEERAMTAEAGRRLETLEASLEPRLRERRFAEVLAEWERHRGDPSLSLLGDRIEERIAEAGVLSGIRDRFASRIDDLVGSPVELRAGGIVYAGKVSRRYDRARDAVEVLPAGRPPQVLLFRDLHADTVDRVLGFLDPANGSEARGLAPDDRFARALFRLRCADPAEGERMLRALPDHPRAVAVLRSIERERSPEAGKAPSRAAQAIGAIRWARESRTLGDLAGAARAYARIFSEFGDLEEVKGQAHALRRGLDEVEAELALRARRDRLLSLAPGGQVEWEGEAPALAFTFTSGGPSSWKASGDWSPTATGWRRETFDRGASLRESPPARLGIPLDAGKGHSARFSIRFPFEAGEPRLVGFAAGGHAFAVRGRGEGKGCEIAHAEGSIEAAEEALRARGTRAPRKSALAFAAGAAYEVLLEVEAGGKTARLLVDGRQWGTGTGSARTAEASGVELRCTGGIELRAVRIAGVLEASPPK